MKHERTTVSHLHEKEFYKLANQENVLNALSALFILLMYFYKDIVQQIDKDYSLYPDERSKLFDILNWDENHVYNHEIFGLISPNTDK